ncbi:hypothetical protein ACLESO_03760 [Pyxidicoccus sp. 3LG]
MPATKVSLRFLPFSGQDFIREVLLASKVDPASRNPACDQVRYLDSFLSHPDCGARSLVVESPYVDRHYLEEYLGYYATQLRPPDSQTTRIHVFACDLDEVSFETFQRRAASGEYKEVQKELSDKYRGFVVIRPLPASPVGRTIFRPYESTGSDRVYGPPSAPHRIHLGGLELTVEGIPFQQQDQGVGACATTALWSSLARVVRTDGGRAPTPLAITLAATQHNHEGRVLPAEAGLELDQMCAAIRDFGYSPFVLKPAEEPELFLMAIQCYVRSGIPPILHVSDGTGGGHAVAVVGFREHHPDEEVADITRTVTPSHALISRGMSRLYVHDDRFGPYARMRWFTPHGEAPAPAEPERELEGEFEGVLGEPGKAPSSVKGTLRGILKSPSATSDEDVTEVPSRELPRLVFHPGTEGFEHLCDPLRIWAALIPLYPKLRLSATDLIVFSGSFIPMMKQMVPEERRDKLRVQFRFAQGGAYLRELFQQRRLTSERAAAFARQALLPRYVGVTEFWVESDWVADVLFDSTDIRRPAPAQPPILGVIPAMPDSGSIRRYLEYLSASAALVA